MTIRNNLLAYNKKAGFGLMWDQAFFGRHPGETKMTPEEWEREVGAAAIDPDTVRLMLDANYYVCPDNELVRWGVDWRRKWKPYNDLAELRAERRLEWHGRRGPAVFADFAAGDFRLRPEYASVAEFAGMRRPAAGMESVVAPKP